MLRRKRDLSVVKLADEGIVVRSRQVVSDFDPAVVGEPEPTYIEGPVMHPAHTYAVSQVILAVKSLGIDMRALNFNASVRTSKPKATDSALEPIHPRNAATERVITRNGRSAVLCSRSPLSEHRITVSGEPPYSFKLSVRLLNVLRTPSTNRFR